MLQGLAQHIASAREHARECRERALATTDETLKADLAEMERAWLTLAKDFQMLKSMEDFLLDSQKHKGISLLAE